MTVNDSSARRPAALHIRLTPVAESIVRKGHPWVFNESIREQSREGEPGELAVVYDRNNRFLAVGLYDPESPIRLRILHAGKPQAIDPAWWEARLQATMARRNGVLDDKTNGLRWINGENDGWPGLVVDQYAGVVVLKLYSMAWFRHLELVTALLQRRLSPDVMILRLSRNIQESAARQGAWVDGQPLRGKLPDGPVVFCESGLRFLTDVVKGQKTGFFLDQRENRRRVERLASGRSVLNLFSYSGGFSLYAARGGATSVTSVDISGHALSELNKNWELNLDTPRLISCRHEEVQADVFEWLGQGKECFDMVVIDPPSLARREREREGALRAYEKLAAAGLARLQAGGVLVCASCSAHVSTDEFTAAVGRALRHSGRNLLELEITGHAQDHPVTVEELRYLKAIFLREEV